MTGLREKVARGLCNAQGIHPDECIHGNASIGPNGSSFECMTRAWQTKLVSADAAIAVCMEEAAKAVCSGCAKEWPLNGFGYHVPPKGYSTWPCHAAALRALRGEGGVDDTNKR